MILVDINLLVYSRDRGSTKHRAARAWLETQFNEEGRVALPWESTLGFLRIVTNPRIYSAPASMASAWKQVEEWLALGNAWIPVAGDDHRFILTELLRGLGGGPNLIPDAHLAALAIEHGLKLCSCDGDFARFRGLRWENPLTG